MRKALKELPLGLWVTLLWFIVLGVCSILYGYWLLLVLLLPLYWQVYWKKDLIPSWW